MNNNKKDEYIFVICAHNDDQIVGGGGTFIKYAKEGKKIVSLIFSYGESSHPWLKREEIVKTRVTESRNAEKITGEEKVFYFGLKEGNFRKQVEEKDLDVKIMKLIKELRPRKIFTHSMDDPHPDHRAVNSITLDIIHKLKYRGDVYTFDVWNPINIRKRNVPKLIVDVTDTFQDKINAFNEHKSQKMTLWTLWWNIYFRSWWYGLKNNTKYAEIFYRIR